MANRELFKTCCLWPSVEVRYTLAWKLAFYFGNHFVTLSHHMTTLKRVEHEALHWVSLFILDKWMERFLSIKIWLLPNLYANFFFLWKQHIIIPLHTMLSLCQIQYRYDSSCFVSIRVVVYDCFRSLRKQQIVNS